MNASAPKFRDPAAILRASVAVPRAHLSPAGGALPPHGGRAGAVSGVQPADAVAKQADAATKSADAVAKRADAVAKQADAVTKSGDAAAPHADAATPGARAVPRPARAAALVAISVCLPLLAATPARGCPAGWAKAGDGPGITGTPLAVLALPAAVGGGAGEVIVGGNLTTAGGMPTRGLARFTPATGAWTAVPLPPAGPPARSR